MKPFQYTSDTSDEAWEVQLECLRRMSPEQRVEMVFDMSRRLRDMAMDAIRRRHPEFDEEQVRLKFIELTYGKQLADEVRAWLEERKREE